MVRLKEWSAECSGRRRAFQFLMVRLKGYKPLTLKRIRLISIPYGSIKRTNNKANNK